MVILKLWSFIPLHKPQLGECKIEELMEWGGMSSIMFHSITFTFCYSNNEIKLVTTPFHSIPSYTINPNIVWIYKKYSQ